MATGPLIMTMAAAQINSDTTLLCQLEGRTTGIGMALPGVTLTFLQDGEAKASTSSDGNGAYRITLRRGSYVVTAALAGFELAKRDIVPTEAPCRLRLDLVLTILPRGVRTTPAIQDQLPNGERDSRRRADRTRLPAQRFAPLPVTPGTDAGRTDSQNEPDADVALLLPPGFSNEAFADAIAITGESARLDRGAIDDRLGAIQRGELAFSDGRPPPAFGPGPTGLPPDALPSGGPPSEGRFGRSGDLAEGGPPGGGPSGPPGFAPGSFPGGGPGFLLGGRGGAQNRLTAMADYTFGGSALDAHPFRLRSDALNDRQPYTRQNFGTTIGGPFKLPGIYNGTGRTRFTASFNGSRGSTLFDQYATVPTQAMRAGDFSGLAVPIIDPATGSAFVNNQIPVDRMSSAATTLLRYLPSANLSGTARNYHYTTTTASVTDAINVQFTHNLGTAITGRPGGRARAAGPGERGGPFGGPGGPFGGAGRGNHVSITAQLQYRRESSDQANVLATLGGTRRSTALTVPVSLNVMRGRQQHAINVTMSRTDSASRNRYGGVEDVAGAAGIAGTGDDSFGWSVPTLSFSSVTAVRDVTPSERTDGRLGLDYTWAKLLRQHAVRAGAGFRVDHSTTHTESNASGTFVFTGAYTAAGASNTGADFADFLLGLPQQASVQYGPGPVSLKSRLFNLFAMDDWRPRSNLTLNFGVRYELLSPYTENSNRMVNLDVTPDFSAASPVTAGGSGPFTGSFPDALLETDTNNIAPRVGVAWRTPGGLVVRGGYGISFNNGSYLTIARQLASQPPFAVTNTQIGSVSSMLFIESALAATSANTTNTFGIDRSYALGRVQTGNIDISRTLRTVWVLGGGYTHTRGSSLDIIRAPNRNADGSLRIAGVQPFLWQTAEGESVLNAATFRIQRRLTHGMGGRAVYTLARSRDNSPSIGGTSDTAAVVAQNDQDLDTEWGPSNFDRRHRLTADLTIELPFGADRRWLTNGGVWSRLLDGWRVTMTFQAESGNPLTARVQGAVSDVAQGVTGALRADYNGAAIAIENPAVGRFFNTDAFSVPASGRFGTTPRNNIIGPGSRQLDAQLARDVRLSGTRALTMQVRATNVLNLVNYQGVDTYVNSPTFGQVQSVRAMRSVQLNARFRF